MAPPSVAVPVTLAKEDVAGLSCSIYCAAAWNTRLPPIVIEVPGVPLPGVKVPPIVVVAPKTVPAPVNAPNVLLKPFKSSVAPDATETRYSLRTRSPIPPAAFRR